MRAVLLIALFAAHGALAQSSVPVPPGVQDQIRAAVLSAPEPLRADATVLGWSEAGALVTLRAGSGEMICVADDPSQDGYSASCYHNSLADYIDRGRELRAEGRSFGEIRDIRSREVDDGSLSYPTAPVTNYIHYGDDGRFDGDSGNLRGVFLRYVVYVPFATVESTGLAEAPMVPGAPWLMDAGTYHAHIMITPPPRGRR